jgi:excisionase family DNA binding protein
MSYSELMDISACAEYLNVSVRQVRKYIKFQGLPNYHPSERVLRFRKSEIDEWLNSFRLGVK